MTPSDLPAHARTPLDADAHGRAVFATRHGGIVVYEVEGADGARIETAQPAAKSFDAVYELLNAHAPVDLGAADDAQPDAGP